MPDVNNSQVPHKFNHCPLGLCPSNRGRCPDPPFCQGAILADIAANADRARNSALPQARQGTPRVTVEAIMYSVSTRGVGALNEPATVERLAHCGPGALKEINQRIADLKAQGRLT